MEPRGTWRRRSVAHREAKQRSTATPAVRGTLARPSMADAPPRPNAPEPGVHGGWGGGHWGGAGRGIDRRPSSEREGGECFCVAHTTRSHCRNSGGRWSCVSESINLSPIPRECESSECLRSRLAGSRLSMARLRLFCMPLTALVLVNRQTSDAPHLIAARVWRMGIARGAYQGLGQSIRLGTFEGMPIWADGIRRVF